MRTCSFALAALITAATVATPAWAFDPDSVFADDSEPRTILRFGYQALKQGRIDDALGAFRYGAQKRDVASEWKLGRMLQVGEGVARDDAGAYRIFLAIADRHVTETPSREDAPFVAHAIVSVGVYHLSGVEAAGLPRDPHGAADHFYRAAALYGDAEAQYRLGQVLRSGELGERRAQEASRWLKLAASKNHARAQAELGAMLVAGDGVRRDRVRGILMLVRARDEGGLSELDAMVVDAMNETTPQERDTLAAIGERDDRHRPYAGRQLADLEQREVAAFVQPVHIGGEIAIGNLHDAIFGHGTVDDAGRHHAGFRIDRHAVDDVMVRQQKPVGCDEEPGAVPGLAVRDVHDRRGRFAVDRDDLRIADRFARDRGRLAGDDFTDRLIEPAEEQARMPDHIGLVGVLDRSGRKRELIGRSGSSREAGQRDRHRGKQTAHRLPKKGSCERGRKEQHETTFQVGKFVRG